MSEDMKACFRRAPLHKSYNLQRMTRKTAAQRCTTPLILEEMNNHGVALIVTSQGIDTSNTNPAGKLQLNVLMAVAEFERGIIRERVNAGLKAAKLRGVRLGRPRSLHKKTGAVLGERRNGLGVRAIARKLQMAPSSVHKILKSTDVN